MSIVSIVLSATTLVVAILTYRRTLKMATQAELATALNNASDQLEKVKTEILQKLQELTDAVNNAGQTTPEVDQALERLRASTQGLDDVVPDPQNI
jgi:hypothetical protein